MFTVTIATVTEEIQPLMDYITAREIGMTIKEFNGPSGGWPEIEYSSNSRQVLIDFINVIFDDNGTACFGDDYINPIIEDIRESEATVYTKALEDLLERIQDSDLHDQDEMRDYTQDVIDEYFRDTMLEDAMNALEMHGYEVNRY